LQTPSLRRSFLMIDAGPHDLRFNLSHSDGMCLYAVSSRREVGIDMGRIRRDLTFNRITARFLSLAEVSTLRAVPESARLQVFSDTGLARRPVSRPRG
jgi:4'-phosphopantetheinyl transferase